MSDQKYYLNYSQLCSLRKIINKNFLNLYKIIHSLDPVEGDDFKKKNEYFLEKKMEKHKHDHQHDDSQGCCSDKKYSKIYIPVEHQSYFQKQMAEMLQKSSFINMLPEILCALQKRFRNIKEKGIKVDKLKWDNEAEQYVLNTVLKEGLSEWFKSKFRQKLIKNSTVESKQPMLLATPQTWTQNHKKTPLNFIEQDNLSRLDNYHYFVQKNYINNIDFNYSLFDELDFIEKSGYFESVPFQEKKMRNDTILCLNLKQITDGTFKCVKQVSTQLTSIPYELNMRMNYSCQISEGFQFSYYQGRYSKDKEQRDYLEKHIDSSFVKSMDSGIQFSCLYISQFKEMESGCQKPMLRLFEIEYEKGQKDEVGIGEEIAEIELERDCLVVLKSRKIGYSLSSRFVKYFIMKIMVNGPPDLKQYKF